jgi:hypothetical protein
MSINRSVYGPLQTSQVALFTSQSNSFYVLKPDPNPKFPPYFGIADGTTNFVPLNLTANIENTETTYTLLTATSQGFQQVSGTAALVSSTIGIFTYQYTDKSVGSLVAGYPLQIIVANAPLTFRWKDSTNEATDKGNATNSNYQPTYNGNIDSYFIIPMNGIPQSNCNLISNNGPFLAYSNQPHSDTFYTTINFCQNQITNPMCPSGSFCGGSTSSGPCYGICPPGGNSECSPTGKAQLSCINPTPSNNINIWKIILIVGAVLIGLLLFGLILYLAVHSTQAPPVQTNFSISTPSNISY